MDKILLNLDDLAVDSFATVNNPDVVGIDHTGCDSACTAC